MIDCCYCYLLLLAIAILGIVDYIADDDIVETVDKQRTQIGPEMCPAPAVGWTGSTRVAPRNKSPDVSGPSPKVYQSTSIYSTYQRR